MFQLTQTCDSCGGTRTIQVPSNYVDLNEVGQQVGWRIINDKTACARCIESKLFPRKK